MTLAHLQDRFTRFGQRSEQPALTLAWAWREMEQPNRAREILQEAARLRPDDGYLLLRSASLVAGLGDNDEADRLLDAAKGKVRQNDWLRAAAEIAEIRLDTATALLQSREILRLEPLALDARRRGALTGAARRPGSGIEPPESGLRSISPHYGLQRCSWSGVARGEVGAGAAARNFRIARRMPGRGASWLSRYPNPISMKKRCVKQRRRASNRKTASAFPFLATFTSAAGNWPRPRRVPPRGGVERG